MKAAVPGMAESEVRRIYDRLKEAKDKILASDEAMKGPAFRETVMQHLEQVRFDAALAQKQTIENALKLQRNVNYLQQAAFKGDSLEAIVTKIQGGEARASLGGNESAAAMATGIQGELIPNLNLDLKKVGLLKVAEDGLVEAALWQEVWERARVGGKPGSTGDKVAGQIADIFHKYNERLLETKQLAGANVRRLDGRVTRVVHDADKLRGGATTPEELKKAEDAWVLKVQEKLNPDRPFLGDTVAPDKVDKYLRKTYQNILSGDYQQSGWNWTQNTARKLEQHRELNFKDGRAAYEYNAEYGSGRPLVENLLRDITKTARESALMYHFGTNPEEGIRKLVIEAKRMMADNPAGRTKLDNNIHKIEYAFINTKGTNQAPGTSMVAKSMAGLRAWQTVSKVSSAIFSVINDAPLAMNLAKSWTDKGITKASASMIGDYLKYFADGKARLEAAARLGIYFEEHNHQVLAQMGGDMSSPGMMSRIMRPFGKITLLNAHVGADKIATVNYYASRLADHAGKSFEQLPPRLQSSLSRYGVDADTWKSFSKAVETDVYGRKIITHDGLSRLGDNEFTGSVTKFDAKQRLLSLYNDLAAMASTTATARERAILLGNSIDEGFGSVRRSIMQFKAVPLQQLNTLETIAHSNPAKPSRTWVDIAKGKADTPALAGTIASMIAMAYVSQQLRELSQGKTARSPFDKGAVLDALQRSGAGGIYGDVLLQEVRRGMGGNTLAALAGPSMTEITNFADLAKRSAQGDKAAGDWMRWAINNTPYHNVWFGRAALDHLIFHSAQEWAQPGSAQAKEKATRKRGQDYFIDSARPTERVRTFE